MRLLPQLVLVVVLALVAAGCQRSPSPRELQALSLATQAREQALLLPESVERQVLVERLDELMKTLAAEPQSADVITADRWCEQFRPVKVSVSYFTELRDFSGDGNIDGLDVRVAMEDRFGDAVKALGDFRVEAFEYVPRANDPRGPQISNWFVRVRTTEDLEKYWDSTDRAFHFPLAMNRAIESNRVIVQVTYYLPDGSGRMLFGERTIRVGQ